MDFSNCSSFSPDKSKVLDPVLSKCVKFALIHLCDSQFFVEFFLIDPTLKDAVLLLLFFVVAVVVVVVFSIILYSSLKIVISDSLS